MNPGASVQTSSCLPEIEYSSRVNPYFPHQVLMETTSACQLRCKMCAREEALRKGTLKTGHMEESLAEKIIDEVAAVNPKTRLWFCFFGEPTLSREVWKRIKKAKRAGIETTVLNSNGNRLIPKICDELIESGLDEIYIGLDAATRETYSKIRVRGDFGAVVQNIHYLLKHKTQRLKVTVQFGVYKENEKEVEAFRSYWSDFGVGIFIRRKLTWIGTLSEYGTPKTKRHACAWIMDSLPVYYNGLVPYCICDWDNRLPQGDINKQTLTEVWQAAYRRWQNLHLMNRYEELPEFCQKCPDWQAKDLPAPLRQLNTESLSFDDIVMRKPSHIQTADFFRPQSQQGVKDESKIIAHHRLRPAG